jgi:hypothetical protein
MSDKTVFVISSGSYSDYSVHGVLDVKTRAEANDMVARINAIDDGGFSGPYRVEGLSIIAPDVERVSTLIIEQNIWDDGSASEPETRYHCDWPFDSIFEPGPLVWRWVRAPGHKGKGGRLEVSGTDHERVRKVFSDRSAMLRAGDPLRGRVSAGGKS